LELERARKAELRAQQEREAQQQRELEVEHARQVALREQEPRRKKEKLVKVKEWISLKNFGEIVKMIETLEVDQLKEEYLSGSFPLEGWVGLNQVFQESKLNLGSHEQHLSRLSDQIEQLEKELVLLKSQRDEVLQTIHLGGSSEKVETAFQVLANAEQELLGGFKEKLGRTGSPDWSVESMSRNDLKLAFSLLGIPHLLSPLLELIQDHQVILMLDFHLLEGFKPQMSVEEKLDAI
jgi:hypothetical protein